MNILRLIISSAPVRILIAIGFGLLGLFTYGRSKKKEGRAEAHREQRDLSTEAMETRRNVEETVRRSGDGTAADELRDKWSRD